MIDDFQWIQWIYLLVSLRIIHKYLSAGWPANITQRPIRRSTCECMPAYITKTNKYPGLGSNLAPSHLHVQWPVKVEEYTIRNDAIWLKMLKSINVMFCSFAIAFTVFEILTFEVWHWKSRSRSEYNIHNDAIRKQILKSTNVMFCTFALALTVLEIMIFEIFDLEKLGKGRSKSTT